MRLLRTSVLLVFFGSTAAVGGQSVGTHSSEPASKRFHFAGLDRTYGSFVEQLSPIEVGGARIGLESPEHSLTLESHAAVLTPLGSDVYDVRIDVRFRGYGKLTAQVAMGSMESEIEDDLLLPSQALRLEGRVRIDAAIDGYTITLLESAQSEVEVRIESRLAGRIVPVCRQLALVLVHLGCDALQETLSLIRVQIPGPGETFYLAREELTLDEASELDAFLEAGRHPEGAAANHQ